MARRTRLKRTTIRLKPAGNSIMRVGARRAGCRFDMGLRDDGAGLNGPVIVTKQDNPDVIIRVEPALGPFRHAYPKQRARILKRDGFTCRYCGTHVTNVTANIDHVKPWRDGGQTKDENLVTACQVCNRLKGNSTRKRWRPKPLPCTA